MSNALFLGTFEDKEYIPHIKSMFGGVTTYVVTDKLELLSHLELYCAKKNITRVVSTNRAILIKLLALEGNNKDTVSLDNYAGSLFSYKGIDIVFIAPLKQILTVNYGRFMAARNISKVISPSTWPEATAFKWALLDATNIQQYYERFQNCIAIATDIETTKTNLAIRCIGYTGIFINANGTILTESLVLPMDSEWALAWMRKFNSLPAAKIFQNGKYDNAYLLRYNAPPLNWLWDTANLFHCWYSELPKDLAFLNAFFLRKVVYWKDLAETQDLEQYYRYNALDTWATANVWIQQLLQMPAWARRNYLLEFPLVYPCLLSEMTGVQRDQERLESSRKQVDAAAAKELSSLQKCIGVPTFNPASPLQVKLLLKAIGCGDLPSTGETFLKKAMFRHPLNGFILGKVLDVRGSRKLATTYLRLESDAKQSGIHEGEGGAKEYKSFWLYSLTPHATDTGRLASGEHAFWCGANIQNVPARKGPIVKGTVRAPEGFHIAECDLEQAESRDTAHIAGDEKLIAAVTGTRDFHSVNCSAFFGVPYENIYDDSIGKTLNKLLRDLAKRVNHGANYNMGAGTLVDTMGLEYIYKARELLKLKVSEPKKIGEYLLAQFHRTYPDIAGKYYVSVINEIGISNRLTSRAYHHTEYNLKHYSATEYIQDGDWTRYCFGKPDKNKLDLNAYVAHAPQSLNARTLNEGYMTVFYDVAINKEHRRNFRLNAQIHDSIFFCYGKGYEYLAEMVRERMEIPVTVRDVSGNYRTFTVPAALKLGKIDKATGELVRAIYWSDTE